MGYREARIVRMAKRRLSGHAAHRSHRVADQSSSAISRPASPPPANSSAPERRPSGVERSGATHTSSRSVPAGPAAAAVRTGADVLTTRAGTYLGDRCT